jgi:ribosomal protein S18 acetylase RimI-like enzyme
MLNLITPGSVNSGIIVGTIENDHLIYRIGSGDTVEILDIQVMSKRRMGIGRRMVSKLLADLPPTIKLVYAFTRSSNEISQEFYKGIGFRCVAVARKFYQGEDSILWGVDR